MKVRVTFELSDLDRVAINVLAGEGFVPAPRERIEKYLMATVVTRLSRLRKQFDVATQEIMEGMDVNTEEENQ